MPSTPPRTMPDGSYTKWGCNCENMNDSNAQFDKLYRVQVGAFRNKESADRMLNSLLIEGFPAFIVYDDGIYKVQVGAYGYLANAIKMEERLRRFRYNTYITT
ncbi:MAG: SPOR domain-containing protein [[Bacteroides] pectinophilus]|nr:SPOR domain-containing protein [[Bacteroides] pectinophilus]